MFAWVTWSIFLMTANTGCLRSNLRLAQSSSNEPIILRIEVFSEPHHNFSSVRPAWSINPRRLIHNLLQPMTPWLAPFSNVVDPPLWTHILKANLIAWATSTLNSTSLWDTNFKKGSILTIRKHFMKNNKHSQNVK